MYNPKNKQVKNLSTPNCCFYICIEEVDSSSAQNCIINTMDIDFDPTENNDFYTDKYYLKIEGDCTNQQTPKEILYEGSLCYGCEQPEIESFNINSHIKSNETEFCENTDFFQIILSSGQFINPEPLINEELNTKQSSLNITNCKKLNNISILLSTPKPSTTPTNTPTITQTNTPTITVTNTATPTNTITPTNTTTNTLTPTQTNTPTITVTNTTTPTITPTITVSRSPAPTPPPPPPPTPSPASLNSANYYSANVTQVGTNGNSSYWGTYDQTGNVKEWVDASTQFDNNPNNSLSYTSVTVGHSFRSTTSDVSRDYLSNPSIDYVTQSRSSYPYSPSVPSNIADDIGFRVASITNPDNLNNFVFVRSPGNSPFNVYMRTTTTNISGTGVFGEPIYETVVEVDYSLGQVDYNYYIGKYTVTNCEYVQFLNAVASVDVIINGNNIIDTLYNNAISNFDSTFIQRTIPIGKTGYEYSVDSGYDRLPTVGINWFAAARYINWLHNGRPAAGGIANNSTEDGAYALNGAINGPIKPLKSGAKYHIPTWDEWFKAAYHTSDSIINASYWYHATQSNSTPSTVNIYSGYRGPFSTNWYCSY